MNKFKKNKKKEDDILEDMSFDDTLDGETEEILKMEREMIGK